MNPAATEVCDAANTDDDCDGLIDDADSPVSGTVTWYRDADADGYGDSAGTQAACDQPSGYVAIANDCDDSSSTISPAAPEVCDGSDTDEDCDGTVDDADASAVGQSTWYRDQDGDTFGSAVVTTSACDAPSGYVDTGTDCDDFDASTSGYSTWYADLDNDGFGDAGSTTSACT